MSVPPFTEIGNTGKRKTQQNQLHVTNQFPKSQRSKLNCSKLELAIFADCRALVDNFVQNGNPRFHAFCTQWKEMMFQHIYSAQSTTVEVLQTTAAAFHIAKRTVCGKEGCCTDYTTGMGDQVAVLRRIGGLYLMYAIYFKQPTEQYVKVEITLAAWQEMKAFITGLSSSILATDEVRYIFWKLLQSHAFRFTALDYCVGLEYLVDYEKVDEEQGAEPTDLDVASAKLKQELPTLEDTQALIPSLAVLEEGYNEMKEILVSTTKGVDAQTLPPTTIFNEIQNVFRRIGDIIDDPQSRQRESKEETGEEPTSELESKRRSLKRKGFKSTHSGNNIKIKAKLEQEIGSAADTSRSQRRMSARTVFAEKLTKSMLNDLEVATASEDTDNTEEEEEADVAISSKPTSVQKLTVKSLEVLNMETMENNASIEEYITEATRE